MAIATTRPFPFSRIRSVIAGTLLPNESITSLSMNDRRVRMMAGLPGSGSFKISQCGGAVYGRLTNIVTVTSGTFRVIGWGKYGAHLSTTQIGDDELPNDAILEEIMWTLNTSNNQCLISISMALGRKGKAPASVGIIINGKRYNMLRQTGDTDTYASAIPHADFVAIPSSPSSIVDYCILVDKASWVAPYS